MIWPGHEVRLEPRAGPLGHGALTPLVEQGLELVGVVVGLALLPGGPAGVRIAPTCDLALVGAVRHPESGRVLTPGGRGCTTLAAGYAEVGRSGGARSCRSSL